MKNSAPAMIDDHHREEHEREPTGTVALLAGVDELLRARRRREQRAAAASAQTGAAERRSGVVAAWSHLRRDGSRTRCGGRFGRLRPASASMLVLLAPVQHEQAEARTGSTSMHERDERRHPQRAEVALEHHEARAVAVGGAHSGGSGGSPNGRSLGVASTSQNCDHRVLRRVGELAASRTAGCSRRSRTCLRIRYFVTSANWWRSGCRSGVDRHGGRRHLGHERGVDRGLHVRRLGRRRPCSPSSSMSCDRGDLRLRRGR